MSWRHFWAGPNTLFGLMLATLALLLGARLRFVAGVLEVCGGHLLAAVPRHCPFTAITLGHVVLAASDASMAELREHERVHVAQYEAWGPLFVPAYLGSSAWQWLCGRDPYRDNHFERSALACRR